jgi:CelD/BcsL family acetyltransferase involved in cellulose biosynthesis
LSVQAEVLSDAAEIEMEWWDLWKRDPAATPFQSPAWLLPWRRHFPDGDSVILTLRKGVALVGLLPLFEHQGRLLIWGAGTTDWLDGLFDPELETAMLSRSFAKLRLPIDLFQLQECSPLLRMPIPEGWSECAGPAESCAILPLPARPGRKMAQNLRYYRRRAARAGIGEPHRGGVSDIDALADLHTRRWSLRDEPGIFADPRMLGWQRQALPALDAAGLLRLYVIEATGEAVAALCVLAAKGRAFYYIGGFDPRHAALGLGTVLVGYAIDDAQRKGDRSFDFLRGREPYKYRWGAEEQPTHARHLVPPLREVDP